ncbi:MAG: hypothetical protein QOJ99_4097 [Bryobacterales bacterium]|nr:hypothetical protein [Bryobacterales bacterium]
MTRGPVIATDKALHAVAAVLFGLAIIYIWWWPVENRDIVGTESSAARRPFLPRLFSRGNRSKGTPVSTLINTDRLCQNPDTIMQRLAAHKPKVMDAQNKLLESRYDLQPRLDP